MELNEERFVTLLEKLIGEVEYLQNNPPKLIPEEDRVVNHLLPLLMPHSIENGGVLKIQHLAFVKNRGNLIISYRPPSAKGTLAFVGSHMDVVPANPVNWKVDPFKLTRDGDVLYGRGTTDCLGHVALITDMFLQFAEKRPDFNVAVTAVFIASEENSSIPGVGVEKLMEEGYLDELKGGPVYWVDSADSQPCIGTAAALTWKVRVEGKLAHSGLPHTGINSIELAAEAVSAMQARFYQDFPPHAREQVYAFASPSSFKPTQTKCAEGSLNQIPPWAEVEGDIRLTPFYDVDACMRAVEQYAADINANITALPTRGPSRYEIKGANGEALRGTVKLTWSGHAMRGIACNIESVGYTALRDAIAHYKGKAEPYSVCGSLPLVGELQAKGFDLQVVGFGKSAVYHGDNEYLLLSDMRDAMKILFQVVQTVSASHSA